MGNVVGYFNPNNWPVVVNISLVNYNRTLYKGEYVLLADKRKINDPLLEAYVGPDMLAKETSKVGVPVVLFPRPNFMPMTGETGFSASPDVVKDARGIVQDSLPAGHQVQRSSGQQSSIGVYSVKDAIAKGIIRPMVEPQDHAPRETDGQPMRLDNVPTIESQTPRDAKPSEVRRIKSQLGGAPVPAILSEANAGVFVAPPAPPQPPIAPVVPPVKAENQVLSDEELRAKTEAMLASIQPSKPVFICKADNAKFAHRSRLLYYVRKKFPAQEAELMADYPERPAVPKA
jgi:hypothetical protein